MMGDCARLMTGRPSSSSTAARKRDELEHVRDHLHVDQLALDRVQDLQHLVVRLERQRQMKSWSTR